MLLDISTTTASPHAEKVPYFNNIFRINKNLEGAKPQKYSFNIHLTVYIYNSSIHPNKCIPYFENSEKPDQLIKIHTDFYALDESILINEIVPLE